MNEIRNKSILNYMRMRATRKKRDLENRKRGVLSQNEKYWDLVTSEMKPQNYEKKKYIYIR